MSDGLGTLLFKEKQVRILLALSAAGKELSLTDLAKLTGVTYIHTSKFIARCEKMGLVEAERHGRRKSLHITDQGKEVASGVNTAMSKMQRPQEVKK